MQVSLEPLYRWENRGLREVKYIIHGHPACKRENWDTHSGLFDSRGHDPELYPNLPDHPLRKPQPVLGAPTRVRHSVLPGEVGIMVPTHGWAKWGSREEKHFPKLRKCYGAWLGFGSQALIPNPVGYKMRVWRCSDYTFFSPPCSLSVLHVGWVSWIIKSVTSFCNLRFLFFYLQLIWTRKVAMFEKTVQ